jgi:hypothetical protein
MSVRALALVIPLSLVGAPAWADGADGTWDTDNDKEEDDDKGCSHMATPVTGLSLILGAALALGLRRR